MIRRRGSQRLRRLCGFSVIVTLTLLLPALAHAEPGSAAKQPKEYLLSDEIDSSTLGLFDDSTGLEIPLTGKRIVRTNNGVVLYTPELPAGTFTFRWEGGYKKITVPGDIFHSENLSSSRSLWSYILCLCLLLLSAVVLILFIRRPVIFLSLGVGVVVLVYGIWVVTAPVKLTLVGAKAAIVACDESANQEECAFPIVAQAEMLFGPNGVKELLIESHNCHELAHETGFELYRKDRSTSRAAMRSGGACSFGLLHGTVEAIAAFNTDTSFIAEAEKYCNSLDDSIQSSCLHAIGHSTIWRTNGDLDAASVFCDKLLKHDPSECKASALMEWSDRIQAARDAQVPPNVIPLPAEPLSMCTNGPAAEVFRLECYVAVGVLYRDSVAVVSNWCLKVEKKFSVACFSALGQSFNTYSYKLGRQKVFTKETAVAFESSVCELGTGLARQECSTEIVRILLDVTRDPVLARAVCNSYPRVLQSICYNEVISTMEELQITGQL